MPDSLKRLHEACPRCRGELWWYDDKGHGQKCEEPLHAAAEELGERLDKCAERLDSALQQKYDLGRELERLKRYEDTLSHLAELKDDGLLDTEAWGMHIADGILRQLKVNKERIRTLEAELAKHDKEGKDGIP